MPTSTKLLRNVWSVLCSALLIAGNKSEVVSGIAGVGACMALLSKSARARLEEIAADSRVADLSGNPAFSDAYMDAMGFE